MIRKTRTSITTYQCRAQSRR